MFNSRQSTKKLLGPDSTFFCANSKHLAQTHTQLGFILIENVWLKAVIHTDMPSVRYTNEQLQLLKTTPRARGDPNLDQQWAYRGDSIQSKSMNVSVLFSASCLKRVPKTETLKQDPTTVMAVRSHGANSSFTCRFPALLVMPTSGSLTMRLQCALSEWILVNSRSWAIRCVSTAVDRNIYALLLCLWMCLPIAALLRRNTTSIGTCPSYWGPYTKRTLWSLLTLSLPNLTILGEQNGTSVTHLLSQTIEMKTVVVPSRFAWTTHCFCQTKFSHRCDIGYFGALFRLPNVWLKLVKLPIVTCGVKQTKIVDHCVRNL